jgi:hypothetical protein
LKIPRVKFFFRISKRRLNGKNVPEKNVRFEVGSAVDVIRSRLVFQKLLEEESKENNWLMVTKIDRLSEDTLDFLRLQDKLSKKSVILNIRGKIPLVLQIVGTIFFLSGFPISPRESRLLAFFISVWTG